MTSTKLAAAIIGIALAASASLADVVTTRANVSVAQAVANLIAAVDAADASIFAVIDHQKDAESIGVELRPTVKVIFGDPQLDTPAIVASQKMGLLLPLEMLIWQDVDGAVYLSVPEIDHEAGKLGLDPAHPSVERIEGALARMLAAAAG
jgi:uncharacterized protein (DUF302 family)